MSRAGRAVIGFSPRAGLLLLRVDLLLPETACWSSQARRMLRARNSVFNRSCVTNWRQPEGWRSRHRQPGAGDARGRDAMIAP